MKTCPYCGQQNAEENSFCNQCGADMVHNIQAPSSVKAASPWRLGYVKFVLYISALIPFLGLLAGFVVFSSPFDGKEALSARLIKVSSVVTIVLLCVIFFVAFLSSLLLSALALSL